MSSDEVQRILADMRGESSKGRYSELSPLNARAVLAHIATLKNHPGAQGIVVVSADVGETLKFSLHVTRTVSSDELNAIGESICAAAGAVKRETGKTQ